MPHGAIVTSVKSYGYIQENDIKVRLRRSELDGTNAADMSDHTHSSTGSLEDTSISNATISLSTHKYWVEAYRAAFGSLPNNLRSVLITYTITEPKP